MDLLNWLGMAGKRAVIVHHDDLGTTLSLIHISEPTRPY